MRLSKHLSWIKDLLSFLSSVAVSMMSVLNAAISSVAHKVAFLITKDFKNELKIVIKKTFKNIFLIYFFKYHRHRRLRDMAFIEFRFNLFLESTYCRSWIYSFQ